MFGRAGIYIAAGYMGSVSVVTTVKWFWFLIGLAALFGVIVHFAQTFKAYADAKGGAISSLYGKLAWLSILAWICYPVVWLFSEGFASFSVSFEVCAYAILDMITNVVVSFMVMSGALFLARQRFGLHRALALCAASCVGTEEDCRVLLFRDEQPTTCWAVWADASPTTPKAMSGTGQNKSWRGTLTEEPPANSSQSGIYALTRIGRCGRRGGLGSLSRRI